MPETTSIPPANKNTSKNRSGFLPLLALILAILAVGLGLFSWNETRKTTVLVRSNAGALEQQTTASKDALATVTQKVTTLQSKVDQLTQSSSRDHNAQLFTEVSHFIRMANLQLVINHNTEATLALLKSAQERLNEMNVANTADLKAAIAQDIASLEKAPK